MENNYVYTNFELVGPYVLGGGALGFLLDIIYSFKYRNCISSNPIARLNKKFGVVLGLSLRLLIIAVLAWIIMTMKIGYGFWISSVVAYVYYVIIMPE